MLCEIPKSADLDNGSFPHHMPFPCGWSRSLETCRKVCHYVSLVTAYICTVGGGICNTARSVIIQT